MMSISLILTLLVGLTCAITIDIPATSVTAVHDVLKRLPAWIADEFASISIENKRQLEEGFVRVSVDDDGNKHVVAGSPTDALYGINYYLRNHCMTQFAWENATYGSGCKDVPGDVWEAKGPKVRFFGNPCTFSYSFAYYTWHDYERFIDWLALNGFNMVLMPTGQEAIWREVFLDLGLQRSDLNTFFTGHAFAAWNRMGNVQAYGTPQTDEFLDAQLVLGTKIVERMVSLGIVPVLPTFSGFVPRQLPEIMPDARYYKNACWCEFNETNSCVIALKSRDPLFQRIARMFMEKQKLVYGDVSHAYGADAFNEMRPNVTDLHGLRDTAKGIYDGCAAADPKCIWIMQSWMFTNDAWSPRAIKSFLSGVPTGKLLVLDLYAEIRPLWLETNSFYGHDFVWCQLHNFGGTREMRGNLNNLNKGYQLALTTTNTMTGAGISMEAINQNYVVYQFMIDRMWSSEQLDILTWLTSYVSSRYGIDMDASPGVGASALKAWMMLANTFYSEPVPKRGSLLAPRFSVFLYYRPKFGGSIKYWFDSAALNTVAKQFQTVEPHLRNNALFEIDYKDVQRERLQYKMATQIVLRIYESYGIGDNNGTKHYCGKLQESWKTLSLLANDNLQRITDAAAFLSTSGTESAGMIRDAKDILTTWGPDGQILDYTHREYSGLVEHYYAKRWQFFCDVLLSGSRFNASEFNKAILEYIEKPFVSL